MRKYIKHLDKFIEEGELEPVFICNQCEWYAKFEGVCCCGDCEHRGGWPPIELKKCEHFNKKGTK